jgi:hypothetical protein
MNICIIGSGIGSLYTAFRLRREGYNVTVFEKEENIGGNIQCCTIDDKLYSLSTLFTSNFLYPLITKYFLDLKIYSDKNAKLSIGFFSYSILQYILIFYGYIVYCIIYYFNMFSEYRINEMKHTMYLKTYFEIIKCIYMSLCGCSSDNYYMHRMKTMYENLSPLYICNLFFTKYIFISNHVYSDGFYKLIQYFSNDINILYNQNITSITRKNKIHIISSGINYIF